MKIAYLSTFYPFRGGIAQFNAALYRELEKDNFIRAFTFKRQYPNVLFPGTSQFVTEQDTADKIDAERVLDTINPLTFWSSARKINKYNPDLMLTKFWMPFFGPSLGQVNRLVKKRGTINISILDNVQPHEKRPGDEQLISMFLKQNHGFIVMSDTVKNDLLEFQPNARYKQVQHPLYDHFGARVDRKQACEKLMIDPEKKILLFFGFIRSYKGLDILLDALDALPDDYLLIIAGEVYGNFDEYDKMIRDRNLWNKVKLFVRYISDDEVPLLFSAADVCILPYKSATQSGIVGISYHFDLPVITTDVGGLKEMITPFGTGMVVDEPKQNKLSAAISDYFNMQMRPIFEGNIKKYKQIANWKSLAKDIMSLYEDIIREI